MSETGIESDAEGDGLVAELFGGLLPGVDFTRRKYSRNQYRSVQRIAPYDRAAFPLEGDFYHVLCHDLSRGGFSFFQSNRPGFSRLVVELSSGPRQIYMVARIAHCRRVLLDAAGDVRPVSERSALTPDSSTPPAVPVTLVGCQFVRMVPQSLAVRRT